MNLDHLAWDSNLFDKKIGKLVIETDIFSESELETTLENAKKLQYNLVYIFTPYDVLLDDSILKKFGGQLVDRRVAYSGIVNSDNIDTTSIVEYEDQTIRKDLLELAYLGGGHSRYKNDDKFENHLFEKLYYKWVENSINKENADKIFVAYNDAREIVGMATIQVHKEYGQIGLISVAESQHKKGIGKKLMHKANQFINKNGVETMYAITQKDNPACRFYEKWNLQCQEIANIYHFWVNS